MPLVAIDWSNLPENLAVYNGRKVLRKMPKPTKDLVIVTENIPVRQALPYLAAGAQIFRCNTNETAAVREADGVEKTHDNDARIIHALYLEKPEKFREFKVDPVFQQFKAMYGSFKDLQHLRVATGNRLYSIDDPTSKAVFEGMARHEKEILKSLEATLLTMPVYTEFLLPIEGIGPATAAGLLAFVGDLNRFPSVSHMMSYFGLDVRGGVAPRKRRGEWANWHQKGRSLLLGVVGDNFVKNRTPRYRDIYDKAKAAELLVNPDIQPIVAERRARRKAVKQFLKDFYNAYKRVGRGLQPNILFKAPMPPKKPRKKRAAKAA